LFKKAILTALFVAASRRGAFWLALGLPALSPGLALAAPGDLDPGFDGDGKLRIDYGYFEAAHAVLVQPDAKIVVAGEGFFGRGDFAISRLNPDGSPDRGFGAAGSVAVDFGLDGCPCRAATRANCSAATLSGSNTPWRGWRLGAALADRGGLRPRLGAARATPTRADARSRLATAHSPSIPRST
jgi:Domain of unknown function (DUF5122) beta-propeller